MSLDVYLEVDVALPKTSSGIFIREDGATVEISREEWDRRYPGSEPVTYVGDDTSCEVYSRNVTHNLTGMARAAGIYQHLWRPDEIDIETAGQLIEPLTAGLNSLRSEPEKFKPLNPPNGWGTYEDLVDFVADYLKACIAHPNAKVRVWR